MIDCGRLQKSAPCKRCDLCESLLPKYQNYCEASAAALGVEAEEESVVAVVVGDLAAAGKVHCDECRKTGFGMSGAYNLRPWGDLHTHETLMLEVSNCGMSREAGMSPRSNR